MAQFIDVLNNGPLKLPTTQDTSSAGNIWFNTTTQRVNYSYDSGLGIDVCSV